MGSITGLMGENGSGKSTTIKAMLDVAKRDSGDVEIPGMKLEEKDLLLEDMGAVHCGEEEFADLRGINTVGIRRNPYGIEAVIHGRDSVKRRYRELIVDRANIEEIMLYYVRGDRS